MCSVHHHIGGNLNAMPTITTDKLAFPSEDWPGRFRQRRTGNICISILHRLQQATIPQLRWCLTP